VHAATFGPTIGYDVQKTLRFLEEVRPTIFLPQCLPAHCLAASIAGRHGLPWAFTVHSDDPDYWAQLREVTPFRSRGRTVCVSEHIASLVLSHKLDPCPAVIPYGVDVSSRVDTYRGGAFHVVYVGRLVERQKRMSLVIASLIQACREHPAIQATVIGDGPERQMCERAATEAGLRARITFIGRIPPEQMKEHLTQAHACLLMSDFEGLPLALLESMAMGVVPVARAIDSGIPELVRHERTGLLVDERPASAARALARLAADRELWRRCAQEARQLIIERYSEDLSYGRWTALIQELSADSTGFSFQMERPFRLDLENKRFFTDYYGGGPWWLTAASCVKWQLLRPFRQEVLRINTDSQ
jgi:glycosyltransferase involved in cell wall biosynthesis